MRMKYILAAYLFTQTGEYAMPSTHESRDDRREALRALLLEGPQPNQQWLVDALNRRGITATQSSVSRDLRDLGAVKLPEGYALPDAGDNDTGIDDVGDLIRETSAAGPHLLVVRTGVGAAQRVALALDQSGWNGVVGTVAGDDTVFVATVSAQTQRLVVARIDKATRQ